MNAPPVTALQSIGGGQDPWNNQGTPGGPMMSPEWAKFFDAINKYAPGGITKKQGLPGTQNSPAVAGLQNYQPTGWDG